MRLSARLRQAIYLRAGGCCEYCRIGTGEQSADFHIDHIIAVRHGGDNVEQNLCLSCVACNSYKGANIAALDQLTGEATLLFNPRQQNWDEHFHINRDASISGRTPEGRATVEVLRLNDESRRLQRYRESLAGDYPCQNNPSP